MPFLDATSLAPADNTDIAAHKCGVVRPTDAAIAKQLYVCTHKFAVWHGTEPNWGLGYEDFADWSLGIATGDPAADEYLWNQYFFQVDALEIPFLKVFSHVEKQPFDTFAEWLHALDVARGKCTDAEVALDIANGITQCDSPHHATVNSLGYEDVITWGMLRNCAVGLRAAAVLERSKPFRGEWSTSPTLHAAMALAHKYGLVDDSDGPEEADGDRSAVFGRQ